MNTILIKEIDGYNVVCGIGKLSIDPESTKKKCFPLIEALKENELVLKKQNEINEVLKLNKDLSKAFYLAEYKKNVKSIEKLSAEIEKNNIKLEKLNEELILLKKIFVEKANEIRNKNIIYFEPAKNEKIISNKELDDFLKLIETSEKIAILSNGTTIDDLRGTKYIKDGKVCIIEKLGEHPSGPLLSEISEEDFEKVRISSMNEIQKAEEFNRFKSNILNKAAQMKIELEIQEDEDPLGKSKEFYNNEIQKLTKKYGIPN